MSQAVENIPIKVPQGMVPKLSKQPDGSWLLEVVKAQADEAVSPDEQKPKPDDAPAKKTGTDAQLDQRWDKLDWATPVPSSPAFTALGMSPEQVTTPSSPRDLALALLNGADHQGRIQTGFAVDFAPVTWLLPDVTEDGLMNNWLLRNLYSTTVSLGTTQVSEGSDAQRVALGVSMRLWNSEEDDITEELQKFMAGFGEDRPINNPLTDHDDIAHAEAMSARHSRGEVALQELFSRLRTQTWGRGSASAAWAPTWLSESGKWSDLRYDGSTAWVGASFQLNGPSDDELLGMMDAPSKVDPKRRFWHFLTQAQFREGESVKGEGGSADKTFNQDSMLIAARLRYGTVDLNGSAEVGYLRVWDGPGGDGDAVRYGLSLERRVSKNTWLVVSAGHETGISGDLPDQSFAVGGIRFGFGEHETPETKEEIKKAGK